MPPPKVARPGKRQLQCTRLAQLPDIPANMKGLADEDARITRDLRQPLPATMAMIMLMPKVPCLQYPNPDLEPSSALPQSLVETPNCVIYAHTMLPALCQYMYSSSDTIPAPRAQILMHP